MIKSKKIVILAALSTLIAGQAYSAIITFKMMGKNEDDKGVYLTGTVKEGNARYQYAKIYITRTERRKRGFAFDKVLKPGDIYSFDDKNRTKKRYFNWNKFHVEEKFTKSRLFSGFQDLFKPVFGAYEYNFRKAIKRNKRTVQKYAGEYYEYTYESLRREVQRSRKRNLTFFRWLYRYLRGSRGSFTVIKGKSIQQIITEKNLSNAAIQSASTSTSLEGGMHKRKSFLSNMQQHAVQGETVSTCLLYGTIYRKYYLGARNYLPGLVSFYSGKIGHFTPDLNKVLKIGIQKNTTIAYKADMKRGLKNEFGLPLLQRTQDKRKISQIMAFALNFKHKILRGKEKIYEKLAKELLMKQYLMTIWVAYLHGIKKV